MEVCPVDAIVVEGKSVPVYDESRCIACYCCMELCPQTALSLHMSLRNRIYRRLGYM